MGYSLDTFIKIRLKAIKEQKSKKDSKHIIVMGDVYE
jgi:hypothetical protein